MTAGGLVFIAGTKDERIHAFDKRTGQLLWEHPLPAGGYATPSTYQVDGRQYVVIAAGGAGKLRTKAGDAFVAFRLQDDSECSRRASMSWGGLLDAAREAEQGRWVWVVPARGRDA